MDVRILSRVVNECTESETREEWRRRMCEGSGGESTAAARAMRRNRWTAFQIVLTVRTFIPSLKTRWAVIRRKHGVRFWRAAHTILYPFVSSRILASLKGRYSEMRRNVGGGFGEQLTQTSNRPYHPASSRPSKLDVR